MSEENVEVVRRVYEAAAGRDTETILALYDPAVELDVSRLMVSGGGGSTEGVYVGHDGLRSLFRDWYEAYESIDYDYEQLTDAGENVIAVVNRKVRGRSSGVEVEQRVALVWTVRDRKVIRVVWFLAEGEALEAAGLSE